MAKRLDLSGKKINRLTHLKNIGEDKFGKTLCLWLCDCGNKVEVPARRVKAGYTTSCGCRQRECGSENFTTHGESKTRFYRIWMGINKRCNNKKSSNYRFYGGKGIKSAWSDNYPLFRKEMLALYEQHVKEHGEKETTIERLDTNKNYCKKNCIFATRKKQANNTSRNHYVTFDGKTLTLAQWCEVTGLKITTLWPRLKRGWSIKDTLTKPKR